MPVGQVAATVAGARWGRFLLLMGPYVAFYFLVDTFVVQQAVGWFNVRVAYRTPTGNVEVGGFVRNLTDEVYKTFVFDAASLSGLIINFVGEPRTYGIDIRIDF